ncbi:MAG: GH3 auxin-responsive promoter family protein [Planctomycetes bacterium]|nr:GH3 auxin-responsive promoter family protein [Planctomycetota bacterium]
MRLVGQMAARLARRRLATLRRHAGSPGEPQQELLLRLMDRMARTAFGRQHGLAGVRTPGDLAAAVPLQDYASMAPWWERARRGEPDVTWPGPVRFWAISSGTTAGEKYLPVTGATIASSRRGGFDALVPHLAAGGGDLFDGKLLFLGGSTALRRDGPVFVGDNTGIMALHVPRCLSSWHTPHASIRAIPDWEAKIAAAAAQTAAEDLRLLAGVPSWIVMFGEAVLAHCRAQGRDVTTLAEVWPNLRLFVHGGVTFAPYRTRVLELVGQDLRCTDTYSASEGGMLAVQDTRDDPAMLPLLDRGAFFEFVPLDELGAASPRRFAADRIEPGVDYAVAVTTDAGIVSYLLGDVVRFTQRDPLRLVFAGRTAQSLNAFGEHVSGGELERGVAAAASATEAVVSEFAVTVSYPTADEPMGCHCYLIEFHREPSDLHLFARLLDESLRRGNEDYATHRSYGLRAPVVEAVPPGLFTAWLRRHGKLGGQHKMPRVLDADGARELRGIALLP